MFYKTNGLWLQTEQSEEGNNLKRITASKSVLALLFDLLAWKRNHCQVKMYICEETS